MERLEDGCLYLAAKSAQWVLVSLEQGILQPHGLQKKCIGIETTDAAAERHNYMERRSMIFEIQCLPVCGGTGVERFLL